MPLTEHQLGIKDGAIDALRAGITRIVIKGSAGTGKTYLMGDLIDTMTKDYSINMNRNNGLIFCTAPTNKALAVLQSKVKSRVEFKTIHGALKMVMGNPDKVTGMRKFIRQKSYGKNSNEFEYCKGCVVDEVSMLNTEILNYLKDYKFPIIFVGDDKQINPVGEPRSPIFDQGYTTFELTEIIRQGKGNPIIDLSRDLDMVYFKTPSLVEGKGYVYDDNLKLLIDRLAQVNGTDEMKHLAWTNKCVDEMNQLVRQRRYSTPAKIELEETLVFNSPFGNFYTNQEVKVEEADTIIENIIVPRHDTRYNIEKQPITDTDFIKLKYYKVNNGIDIIHEDSETVFKTIASDLSKKCKTEGWNWQGYYAFVERFADIKYNHSLSVHKSLETGSYKTHLIDWKLLRA